MTAYAGEELAHWLRQRAGKLTASNMWKAMDFKKDGKPTSERSAHQRELLAERLTGDSVKHFVSGPMLWGLEHEEDAKAAFEAETGNLILEVGFFDHPTIDNFGATPDGRLDVGLLETKCPTTVKHIEWIMAGVVPEEHKPQMCAQLLCTMEDECTFVSYDPRMRNPRDRLFIAQYIPTPAEREKVEMAAVKFLAEVDEMFDIFVARRT